MEELDGLLFSNCRYQWKGTKMALSKLEKREWCRQVKFMDRCWTRSLRVDEFDGNESLHDQFHPVSIDFFCGLVTVLEKQTPQYCRHLLGCLAPSASSEICWCCDEKQGCSLWELRGINSYEIHTHHETASLLGRFQKLVLLPEI